MMKMATGEGSPLRQGAGTGSRLVFGGYRGLRRRNSDLFCSPMFLGYMDIYRRKKSVRGATRGPRGWEPRGQARLPASWGPRSSSDVPLHPYIPMYPKTSRTEDRLGVPPPQAFVATKNLSGVRSGALPEGNPSPVAIFIIPTLSMTRRE